jgi:uncharacterized protein YdeI (YjbR/CyaY-like superfamily)
MSSGASPGPTGMQTSSSSLPPDLAYALQFDLQARRSFDGLPDARRRELLRGIARADTPGARRRSVAAAIDVLRLGR